MQQVNENVLYLEFLASLDKLQPTDLYWGDDLSSCKCLGPCLHLLPGLLEVDLSTFSVLKYESKKQLNNEATLPITQET